MRIGVLTAFSGMVEHYSLTRVVMDQLRMIKRAGHDPVLIVLSDFKSSEVPGYVDVRPDVPVFAKIDYCSIADLTAEHVELVPRLAEGIALAVRDLDAVLTHDIVFTGWNLPMNLAIQLVAAETKIPWLHWMHSVPGGERKDFWTLPKNSKLVYPNFVDRRRCAESFGIYEDDVLVAPHSLDARDYLLSTEAARYVANEFDLLGADFVQIFPIPTDRMESKGLDQVVKIFGHLKKLGKSIRLVVVNSWCTNDAMRRKIDNARILCRLEGLDDQEVAFTSRELKHYEVGVPNAVVRDLMLLGNLFVCPTKSETFGFTMAEAALAGQLLVLNADLPAVIELAGAHNALFFHFGSYQQHTFIPDEEKFYSDIARIIIHVADNDLAMKAKNHYKKCYRSETVWTILESAIVGMAHGNHR